MLFLIFLIIFSVIALYNLRYGIYLVIFLMPLYLWRFSILGIPSTALEAMIYVLFLVWIFGRIGILDRFKTVIARSEATKQSCRIQLLLINSGLLRFTRSDNFWIILSREISLFAARLASKRFCLLNIGIILLFFGVIISTSISTDPRTSLGIFKGWFFDPFLFFIIFINVINTRKEIYLSLASWLFSGAAVSLISIFYLLNGDLTFDGRLSAFFLSPNHLSMYLSPAFLILLFFVLDKKNLSKKVFSIKYLVLSIFLLIVFIPLYFTYSYGAFLGIFAGIVYLLLAENKCNAFLPLLDALFFLRGFSRRLRSFSFTNFQDVPRLKPLNPQLKLGRMQNPVSKPLKTILLFLIFTSFLFITFNKSSQIIDSQDRSSFHSRLMIWSAAAKIIKDNPLFGIGPGTFQEIYLSYAGRFDQPYLEWAVPQPHNIFLAFYLQTGLIGFLGFVLILFWFFQRRRHSRMSPSDGSINNIPISQYPISNILISLMIYILVHGLVDTTYWKNDLALMFWLVIGIMVATKRIEGENKNEINISRK